MMRFSLRAIRARIPLEQRTALRKWRRRLLKPAWLGTLRRTRPLSDRWGADRGTPVDRYYIEKFLQEHRQDIRGRVLEVKDGGYTRRFGQGVTGADVLDVDAGNTRATIVADLADAVAVPGDTFDCFILTQTLQLIYDTQAAVRHAHRVLRRGGVLLVTVPCVSRIAPEYGSRGDFWRFTVASCVRLFGDVFGKEHVDVRSFGNVLVGVAFLTGMAREELTRRELEAHDAGFPLVIAVRATK